MPNDPGRKHPIHFSPVESHNRPVIIFLTVCTKGRQPLLADSAIHDLLVEWWKKADRWLVTNYIILPDHIHLFCTPHSVPEESLHKWVAYWKNGVARHWPGGKNRPIWQRDFWDTQLRSGENYAEKWEYIRHNPVRHGLSASAEAWPYQGALHSSGWMS